MHFFFFPNSSQISHHNSEKVLGVLVVVFVFVAVFFFFLCSYLMGTPKSAAYLQQTEKGITRENQEKAAELMGKKRRKIA